MEVSEAGSEGYIVAVVLDAAVLDEEAPAAEDLDIVGCTADSRVADHLRFLGAENTVARTQLEVLEEVAWGTRHLRGIAGQQDRLRHLEASHAILMKIWQYLVVGGELDVGSEHSLEMMVHGVDEGGALVGREMVLLEERTAEDTVAH
jgi:hypothetical protein